MVRENFRGSNTQEGQFREIAVRDNSEQILKQSERYIEQLKRLRDAETQIQSAQIRDAEAALSREANYDEKLRREQIQASRTIADMQVRQLQAQAKEIQSITGRNANITGEDSTDVDNWINFVTKYSDKAASMFADAEQKKADFQWEQGIAKAHMFGANFNTVAWNRQFANQNIMSMNAQALAGAAEAAGADPAYVEQIRKGDAHFVNATKHALAARVGDESAGKFKNAMGTDTETMVTITGPDGKQKEIPLNQIDPSNAAQVQEAYYQWLPDYYRNNGFGDASSEFLTDSLTRAKSGFDTLMGSVKSQQLQRNKVERIDEAVQNFRNLRTPQAFAQAVNVTYNLNGGSRSMTEVRKEIIGQMSDLAVFSNQAEVDAILDTPLGEGQKSLREQYPQQVQDMVDRRLENQQRQFDRVEKQKGLLLEQKKTKFNESIEADRADGTVDISNEKLDELAQAEIDKGDIEMAEYILSFKAQTADTQRTKDIIENFDTILAEGRILTPKDVLNSGLDFKDQQKYLQLANQSIQTALPEADAKEIAKEVKMVLANNAKINMMAKTAPTTLAYASEYATTLYRQDFVTFMKKPGATTAEAKQYAREQLHRRIKDDPMFALGDLTRDANGDISTEPYPAFVPKESEPIDDFNATLVERYRALAAEGKGREMFTEAHPELIPVLQSAVKTVNNNGAFTMPPVINEMARLSGGKLSPIQIFRLQSEAAGITDLPESFQIAEEVQTSIPQEYQSYLNFVPSTTRTDIAMVGSGKEPIYEQVSAEARQVMDIVGKYESDSVGGYNAMNSGVDGQGNINGYSGVSTAPGGLGRELTSMTLNEILQLQEDPNGLFAVGRYQFTNHLGTLKEAMAATGITGAMKFTPEVQDQLFLAHFDKHGVQPWDGPRTNATENELNVMRTFRQNFDYKRPTWRQSKNMNPRLAQTVVGQNTGIVVTSAQDASGEPGSDFVVGNGVRGAKFHFPYQAEVLKVVNDQNWETNLEKGPGRRGYGNLVELRVTLPNGTKSDVLIAHFDKVADLQPGQTIPAGSFIGTQGRTGSTTGAHISMDWYKPDGSASPNLQARNYFLQNYLRKGG